MDPWDLYFCSLCAWLLHPGYLRDGAARPSLNQIADMVDEMLAVREERR